MVCRRQSVTIACVLCVVECLVCSVPTSTASDAANQVSFDPVDIGVVSPVVVSATCVVRNRSLRSIEVVGAQPSCVCASAEIGVDRVIGPGKSKEIALRLNLHGRTGSLAVPILFRWKDSSGGEFVSEVLVQGSVRSPGGVSCVPRSIELGEVKPGVVLDVELVVVPDADLERDVKVVQIVSPVWVTYRVVRMVPRGWKVQARITIPEDVPVLSGEMIVRTDYMELSECRIPIRGFIRSRVIADPKAVVGTSDTLGRMSAAVGIDPGECGRCRIQKVTVGDVSGGQIIAEPGHENGSLRIVLDIRLHPGAKVCRGVAVAESGAGVNEVRLVRVPVVVIRGR